MPKFKTSFNQKWLDVTDSNSEKLRSWCTQGSTVYTFKCSYCLPQKEYSCAAQGKQACLQHAKTEKHAMIVKGKNTQCKFGYARHQSSLTKENVTCEPPKESSKEADSKVLKNKQYRDLQCFMPKEQILRAEIIWILEMTASNISYRPCKVKSYSIL